MNRNQDLTETLTQRGERYGKFADNAELAQRLKGVMARGRSVDKLSYAQEEALHQIAAKISRILTGDPDYIDNWHDIAGYAKLAEEDINERAMESKAYDHLQQFDDAPGPVIGSLASLFDPPL